MHILINTLVDDAVDSLCSNGNLFSNGVGVGSNWQLARCGRNSNGIVLANFVFVLCFSGFHQTDIGFCQADVTCPEGSAVLEMMMVANIPFVSLRSIRGQGREEEACCATDNSMSVPINHVSAAWYLCMSMESATATATVGKERPGSRALIMFVIPMAALLDWW
jgi:hypothetical protein